MLLNKLIKKFILVSLSLLAVVLVPHKVTAQANSEDIFSPENRLSFGNFLFCEKDYLRAISEYRYYLQQTDNDTVRFKIAFALSEMKRYDESMDNFKGLFYNSDLSEQSRLEFYKTSFQKDDDRSFRLLVEGNNYMPDSLVAPVKKLYNISLLRYGGITDSATLLLNFEGDEKLKVMEFYSRKINPDYKSESTAAILSSLLPGLGKVYADEIGDGITSFLFTGVLTYLAVNNFKNDHPIRGWVFSGLAAYFYTGNIYGSMAAVQNYNTAVKFRFDTDLNLYISEKNWFIPVVDFICK